MIKYIILYVVIIVALNCFFDFLFKKRTKTNYYNGPKSKKKLLKMQAKELKKIEEKENSRKGENNGKVSRKKK